MSLAQRIVLASRPKGRPIPENFRLEQYELPPLADGEVALRVQFLSLDPYMRGRMDDAKSYAPPVPINGVMDGEAICEVTESKHQNFQVGDVVRAFTGWCTHAVVNAAAINHFDTHGAPTSTAVGAVGMPGFTAYSALKVIGQVKPGETVVVAAASGPVGSMVGQLAKLWGARAVGIAGGKDKCDFARSEIGFDSVIDHRSENFASELAKACPDGIDVYFELVGGKVWNATLPLLNKFARVPVCGLVAYYNDERGQAVDQLPSAMLTILKQSLLVRGFIQTEFIAEHYANFEREIGPLVAAGRIKYREDIVDGLERAPNAFAAMLEGGNFGKLLVRVG
ncbi:NADP-dependent oxidoreductase [Robbsia andropogonis]|uniref:NADP-dependent oxidoreductase n=1 Tax=Robbsia andropogonis TaxID=28092 RepID=A0A0F5JVH2_9BURK|nr:NADP-dependent oxidoreductase [Robbsia andropogonis]KKB61660.1 NADP-dependent oxidoreductase [Robbsia andropogonis]MCP1120812.1 NADP-dependent oxidoreductase [Robbsia andropogonis]MCP1130605.1 NADP-dependent oxidoreductase [Robbsia andropogonis]